MVGRQLALAALGVSLAAFARVQPRPDPVPASPTAQPSPEVLRVLTVDRPTVAASLLWMETVRRFVESPDTSAAWVREGVPTTGALDPAFRSPWIYGALMLEAVGDIEGHEQLLEQANSAHPTEPWFAFRLGVSRDVHHADLPGAIEWFERAASLAHAQDPYDRILANARRRWAVAHGGKP